jgi:hypothetical protein
MTTNQPTNQPTNHANIEPSRFSNQCLNWGDLANLEFGKYAGHKTNQSAKWRSIDKQWRNIEKT